MLSNEELWREMEKLATTKQSLKRDVRFMNLMRDAYEDDLDLIISCEYDEKNPGIARQGYMNTDEGRMLVCYTSKERAMSAEYNMDWGTGRARDFMNNMFNKDSILGMVFNPNDAKAMVLIFKELLDIFIPRDKPKPEFYAEW